VAKAVDLDGHSRNRKVSPRRILTIVGDWPESRQLPQFLVAAQAGDTGTIDQDAIDDRVAAHHRDATKSDIIEAIERARDSVANWVSGSNEALPAFDEFALTEVASPLGPLPVITYAHAAAFQLAISARDLRPAGAVVPASLQVAGLQALLDTTGALAARLGVTGTLAAVTPTTAVSISTVPRAWRTFILDPDSAREEPGIEGGVGTLLDMASGRKNPIGVLRRRKVKIRRLPEVMRYASIAQEVPGLPGGPVLSKAAGLLSIVARSSRGTPR